MNRYFLPLSVLLAMLGSLAANSPAQAQFLPQSGGVPQQGAIILQGNPAPGSRFTHTINSVKDQQDQRSERSAVDSLRLQQQMDRQNQMTQTLSNVMKRTSETQSNITGNLK